MPTRGDRRGLLRRAVLTRGALPYTLAHYSVSGLPAASLWTGAHVFVLDDVSGAVEAFSDGVYWRRLTDQVIVSAVSAGALYGVGAGVVTLEVVTGPYLISTGAATGTLAVSAYIAAALSGTGAAVATLATPPKVPTDLSGTGAAVGTMVAAARAGAALSAAGAAANGLAGVAA